jgi:hypothetical protein
LFLTGSIPLIIVIIKEYSQTKTIPKFPMELRSNQAPPQPVPHNLQASPPTSTKAQLGSVLLELLGNVKEKKVTKSNKMRISDYSIFGEPIKFSWNKSDAYRTNSGFVFTLLFVAVLGYIIWLYFGEWILCKKPSVYESTTNYPILGDDPDNDLATLFPVISFLDYSHPKPWPNGLPAVPFSDITCHFRVEFAHATTGQWLYIPGVSIPINGDCNAKFREMYKKKTGKDDEDFTKGR